MINRLDSSWDVKHKNLGSEPWKKWMKLVNNGLNEGLRH